MAPWLKLLVAFVCSLAVRLASASSIDNGVISFGTRSSSALVALPTNLIDHTGHPGNHSPPSALRASKAAPPFPALPRYQKPYNICTSAWTPFIDCTSDGASSTYSGYQIDLWRLMVADLGWAEEDWFFSCLDWSPMIDDLLDPNGNCFAAAAGKYVCWRTCTCLV